MEHLQFVRFDNVREFYDRVRDFLLVREAEHNLILGLCNVLIQEPEAYPEYYLALVERGGEVVAASLRTPPHNVILSHTEVPEALPLFARDIQREYGEIPGVIGSVPVSEDFAGLWQELTGQPYEPSMSQRIYKLEEVRPPKEAPGYLRPVMEQDRETIIRWFRGFYQEAMGDDADVSEHVSRRLRPGSTASLYLWEDSGPVSMVGTGGPTPHGIRIGPVYTPPEKRRRGYASACVAAVSQLMLASGRQFCFLYTDLMNPTSNHIYQEIGYRPVCDSAVFRFLPASGTE